MSDSSTNQSIADNPSCTVLRLLLNQIKEPIIIGIAGDSGSGKTTFSNGIRQLLGPELVQTIEADGYHKENRSQRALSGRLPLDPDVNKLDLILKHIKDLKAGKTIQVPKYNHATGDFDPPYTLTPSPIIIFEGLHILYPQFSNILDFKIFCDPCREVKRQWKYERDIKKRGHQAEKLEDEMLKREAAYKRWVDFQKTDANVIIKIFNSDIPSLSGYEFTGKLPEGCFKIELIMEPATRPLPSLLLPFDLASFMDSNHPPFLLATIPCNFWGRQAMDIRIDGVLSNKTTEALKREIIFCTGIEQEKTIKQEGQVSASEFTQLIIAWRFLEEIISRYTPLENGKPKQT